MRCRAGVLARTIRAVEEDEEEEDAEEEAAECDDAWMARPAAGVRQLLKGIGGERTGSEAAETDADVELLLVAWSCLCGSQFVQLSASDSSASAGCMSGEGGRAARRGCWGGVTITNKSGGMRFAPGDSGREDAEASARDTCERRRGDEEAAAAEAEVGDSGAAAAA